MLLLTANYFSYYSKYEQEVPHHEFDYCNDPMPHTKLYMGNVSQYKTPFKLNQLRVW